jgi:hypothetical protein
MATETIKPVSTSRTCSVAGTAIRVAASSVHAERYCDTAVVQAHPSNTGNIFVGGSDVSSSNGFVLEPGDAMNLGQFLDKKRGAVLDLYNFWVVSATNNDVVRVIRSTAVPESEL